MKYDPELQRQIENDIKTLETLRKNLYDENFFKEMYDILEKYRIDEDTTTLSILSRLILDLETIKGRLDLPRDNQEDCY